ncbi:PQQ-binding-like beta-propeller repeat protein [Polaribacter sp. Z022]|uniref:PQQ-binding-like beta-propeller repeat protein n=1 Tax=Polaribacter sp. Z022 TaxID=2927125 RepID=UPI002020FE6B|nr:PQQ-binding-like beta-propeller repeat protein [Polaribacter sp. Z022]MCL7752988.1 PQQ-binding-like beta-propeller repeat protein [Polaribacter sp. Z022]
MKSISVYVFLFAFVFFTNAQSSNKIIEKDGIKSIDTKHTISKVRIAKKKGKNYIVNSSFKGTLLAIDYNGKTLWKNKLSGFMNQDVWCSDITGDGNDEILAANADGTLYCLNKNGKLLWKFKKNDAPMYAVTAIKKDNSAYVVCGGFDKNIYYLSSKGKLVKTLASSTYSKEKFGKLNGKSKTHIANFLRVAKQADGSENLVVVAAINSMQHKGAIYLFEPLADKPYKRIVLKNKKPIGDVRISKYFGNGKNEILAGTSTILADTKFLRYNLESEVNQTFDARKHRMALGKNAYLVPQTTIISDGNSHQYFTIAGSRIVLLADNFTKLNKILVNKYTYNDMWHDTANKKIILGSVQSGGSCIHIIDYTNKKWKSAFEKLEPHGKIEAILANTEKVRKDLRKFKKPSWERNVKPIFFVSDLPINKKNVSYPHPVIDKVNSNYDSPSFLAFKFFPTAQDPKDWNRDTIPNQFYRDRRDRRKKYTMTEADVLEKTTVAFKDHKGLAMWGGHGNDPFFYSSRTKRKLIDASGDKKMVFIFPELENHTKDFKYVLDDMLYPLAKYGKNKNVNIHLRCKNIFWQGPAYMPMWSRLQSGEFADIFVPTMEETSDKSMDLSVAGRVGYWLGGSVNQWGTRSIMDNASYDRLRQFSSQRLPNHAMRQIIYAAANGATHFNNFAVDQDYFSVVWELIAKGALYVPNRNELLSLSPVHLSMTTPDHHYLESSKVKSIIEFSQEEENKNKMVFGRINGSWPAAPVTEWDFSKYAANETERRLNFIPSYNNGLVLITPVQNGTLAKKDEPRGKLVDKLHPIYKNILKEYITDGRNYISADGKQKFPAETYYKTIKKDIEKSAKLLPLTVSGNVGWVVAQTDKKHIRLTLVDGDYISPSDKEITVTFHTAKPKKMTDLLNGENFSLKNTKAVKVKIPCGSYRFIDIELQEKL